MTLSEFLDAISEEQFESWLRDTDPSGVDTKAYPSWKYYFEKDGKRFPVKFLIDSLAAYCGLNMPKKPYGSNDDTRYRVAEKFGLEVVEELVFDASHKQQLDKRLKKIKNKDVLQQFIQYSHDLLEELDIPPAKIRMAIRSNGSLMVVIAMRGILFFDENEEGPLVTFIVGRDFTPGVKDHPLLRSTYNFKGDPPADDLEFLITDWGNIPEGILEENKAAVKREYWANKDMKRIYWNKEANTTNDALKYAIFKNVDISDWNMEEMNLEVAPAHAVAFFNSKDFENIRRYTGQKMNYKKNHLQVYDELKACYGKVEYWAHQVQQALFQDGYVVVKKRPTNQANRFEEYLWGRIYPEKASNKQLAFTVSIDAYNDLNVKIDTVHLKDNDPNRVKYLQYRGDFSDSAIVKVFSYDAVLKMDWDQLIHDTTTFFKEIRVDYDHLSKELFGNGKVRDYSDFRKMNPHFPLNQILYGPPGTGKTYHTISLALKIIGEEECQAAYKEIDGAWFGDLDNMRRGDLKKIYQKLVDDKRIFFTTFHQSMTYEEFVEGIKPEVTAGDNPSVIYKTKPGIFRQICEQASKSSRFTVMLDDAQRQELTEALFEDFYYSFSRNLPDQSEEESAHMLKTKEGYPFYLFKNSRNSIVVKAGMLQTNMSVSCNELTKVLFEGKLPVYKSYEQIIIDKILEGKEFKREVSSNESKNFVLIIDEINRGNISAILGELITLLEPDKRKGCKEELSVTLPYSKEKFSVPPNVYVIGTMNTADRSVEALDTALRRRFSFIEMPPRPELLTPERMVWKLWWDSIEFEWEDEDYAPKERNLFDFLAAKEELDHEKESIWNGWIEDANYPNPSQLSDLKGMFTSDGFPLESLLTTINQRIEKLLDKDHLIGHSYFMNVNSYYDLQEVFYNKLIPLLEEYFYGDHGKIGLVLGQGFVQEKALTKGKEGLFADFDYEAEALEERKVYEILDYRNRDQYAIKWKRNVVEVTFAEALKILLRQTIDKGVESTSELGADAAQ